MEGEASGAGGARNGMKEYKQVICDLLLVTLNATRDGRDIVSLEYIKTDTAEEVIVTFENGHQQAVNVACDSGTAMIKDIMSRIF